MFGIEICSRLSPIMNRQSHRPAAAITFFFLLGIVLSRVRLEYSFRGLAAGTLCLICASILALRRNRLALSFMLGLSAIMISGLLMAIAHRDGFPDSDLRCYISRSSFPLNEPVCFEGCVIRESEGRGAEIITTVEMRAFLQKNRWMVCRGKGILRIAVPAPGAISGQTAELMRGDRVRGWANWHIPRNYENPGSADRAGLLAMRGIFLVGRVKSARLLETIPGDCSNAWTRMATSVGTRVRTGLEPLQKKENGQPAAVLASLVIGDYSGLDNNTREIFQDTGTFHVLVVSGLHVAWIAGLLLQVLKWMCLPERIRYLLVNLVILFYTCVVGFQASLSRCLWMFLLYLAGRMMFRRADTVNILLASGLILLIAQPTWLFETGFQLSFLSILAIALTAVPAIRAYVKPVWDPLQNTGNPNRLFLQPGVWHRCGRNLRARCEIFIEGMTDSLHPAASRAALVLCRGVAGAALGIMSIMITTVSVQLWIEPLLALYFNRVSWIAPLAALLVVPFSSVVLASGVVGAFAAAVPACGSVLMQFAGSLASGLLSVTRFFSEITGAWQRCPTPSPPFVWGSILTLFLWRFFEWRRSWISCTFVVVLLACLSRGFVPDPEEFWSKSCRFFRSQGEEIWEKNASVLRFTFLDVGEGDSIVICLPDNRWWVLDAGGLRTTSFEIENAYVLDIGEAVVSRYLWHGWITKLDRLILSHTDLDHAGGIPAVMKNFKIGRFDYSEARPDAVLGRILQIADQKHIVTKPLHAGMKEQAGHVAVRVLNPPPDSSLDSTNDNSLVLEFTFERFSALLTADLEKTGELYVLSRTGSLSGQLLKVAHHGSRSATSDALLDRIQSRWAIISAGRNNPFGHPSQEVLARLRKHGVRSYLTPDEGALTLETDGSRYVIKSHLSGILERGNF